MWGLRGRADTNIGSILLSPILERCRERIVRAINHPARENASAFLFAWTDTKEVRPANATAYAVLNDQQEPLKQEIIRAFEHYEVKTILWSQRERFVPDLAA